MYLNIENKRNHMMKSGMISKKLYDINRNCMMQSCTMSKIEKKEKLYNVKEIMGC